MKLKNLIEQGILSGFEIVPNAIVLSVFIREQPYALDVDTSELVSGTSLVRVNDYSVNGDTLIVDNISINIDTEIIGFDNN
jgi:hypothetical protein